MVTLPLVKARPRTKADGPAFLFRRHVSRAVYAVAIVFFVGTAVDLGILWFGQRQATIQWEFVALTSTSEALPRFILAIGCFYLGLFVRQANSLYTYRLLALGLVGLGLLAAAVGALMVTDYFPLVQQVNAEALPLFKSSAYKTFLLTGIYVAVLIPVGILGLRRPRSIGGQTTS